MIHPHMHRHMYTHVIRTVAAHLMANLVVGKVKLECVLLPFVKVLCCSHVESYITRAYICLCLNYLVVIFLL